MFSLSSQKFGIKITEIMTGKTSTSFSERLKVICMDSCFIFSYCSQWFLDRNEGNGSEILFYLIMNCVGCGSVLN